MIPAIHRTTRRRLVWEKFMLGGIERLTEWLMSGDAVCDEDFDDLREVRKRLSALDRALEARERAAGLVE